jgi:flagellar FliL protein
MAEEQEVAGKSKKKLMVMVGIIVFSFIVACVGALYFLLVLNKNAVVEEKSNLPDKAIYVKLKTKEGRKMFITSVKTGNDRARMMQIYAEAKLRSKISADALKLHMPVAVSKINILFATQDFDVITTYEGKQKMQREAARLLNTVLLEKEGVSGVEAVLFTNMVIQ